MFARWKSILWLSTKNCAHGEQTKKNKTKLKKVLLWYQTESSFKVMEYVMDGVTVSNFWISYYRNTFIEGALAGESAESKTL